MSTETLADHAEGLLGESEAGRVQAHLDDCADCRSEALLLVSLQEILRADEVGPMPAEYASRIDVALAELALAEPVVVRPGGAANSEAVPILTGAAEAPAAVGGAKVIDLATRRKVMMTGLRRVGTVAAGVVLLIGGAALGVQTLGNHTDLVPSPNQDSAQNAAQAFKVLPTAPATATKGKGGIKTDPKTGWIYLKSGKVLLPDGTVILPGANKSDPPTVITPKQKPVEPAKPKATDKTGKSSGQPPLTAVKPANPAATTAPVKPAQPAEDPAAPSSSNNTNQPEAKPAAKSQTAVAPNSGDKVGTADAQSKDTYVSQSGSEYTQDNFASKVMDLMAQASQGSSSPGTYTQTSSGRPQTEPSPEPTTGPSGAPSSSVSPSMAPQNLAISYYEARQFDMQAAAPGRGPASPEVKYRVQRCAQQLGTTALAGDEGTWNGHKATIVVTPTSDNPNQVIGYVFYGNCAKSAPATEDTAQWVQRVNKPSANPAPASTPVPRVGGTSPDSSITRSESESTER